MSKKWIAVDWGTSNFRAWLLQGATVLEQVTHPCGLLHIEKGAFAQTLYARISHWLHEAPPILMAGMVGSPQGWQAVPYCSLPATAAALAANVACVETPWNSPAWIIPGVSGVSPLGLPEVMRGEEVQLIGLNARAPDARHVILPGTHSKHATLEKGAITAFSTFMTGELFSVLTTHSLLGRDLPEAAAADDDAFRLGVRYSALNAPLSQLLFSARTLRLRGDLPASGVRDYLSGLLIGAELRHCSPNGAEAVGGKGLCQRYHTAAQELGVSLRLHDGDACFLAGMTLIYHTLQGAC